MKNQKLTWHTETRKVSDLVPNIKNPRTMSPRQIEDLKSSLKKFNLVEIPVINLDNQVVAGHQRLSILKLLGRESEDIEVRVPNRTLTLKEYDQYLLTSNRVHGDWDFSLLEKYFDMETLSVSGFDDVDLSKIFDLKINENQDENLEDDLPDIKDVYVKTGDIYELGKSRLICGDATNIQVVEKLMNGEKASFVLQDPPFNVKLSYNKGVGGKESKRNYGGEVDDDKSEAEYKKFLKVMLENALSVSKKDVHFLVWQDERWLWLLQTIYNELGISNKRIVIWIKNNFTQTPNIAFSKCTEFAAYGTVGSPYLAKHVNDLNTIANKEMSNGNNLLDEIYDHLNVWAIKRLPSNQYNHPTEKSHDLHHKAIRRCTKVNDIILDLTAGSGSIMQACHKFKRIAYMCEMSPVFCQVIINKYNKISNEKARKIN